MRIDCIVAIKVLPAEFSERPELRERFEREARTLGNLKHPHICVLHDIGHAQIADQSQSANRRSQNRRSQNRRSQSAKRRSTVGTIPLFSIFSIFDLRLTIHYLVMEYLEGETVADRLKKGALLPHGDTHGIACKSLATIDHPGMSGT